MSQKYYKFRPGQCTCVLGDAPSSTAPLNVRKAGGAGAQIDYSSEVKENQTVAVWIRLESGMSLSLRGTVVFSSPDGTVIEWTHPNREEADRLETVFKDFSEKSKMSDFDAHRAAAARGTAASPPGVAASATPAGPASPAAAAAAPGAGAAPEAATATAAATAAVAAAAAADAAARAAAAAAAVAEKAVGGAPAAASVPRAATPPVATPQAPEPRAAATASAPPPSASGPAPPAAAKGVVDVTASIRKRATKVRARDLASRVDEVNVMGLGSLKGLIKEMVDETIALHGASLAEEERRRILEEVEESVKESFQAERANLEEKALVLEKQLKNAQGLLKEERTRVLSASQFTVSDAGMIELEQRLTRILDRAVSTQEIGGPLEQEMRSVMSRLLDDERKKIHEQAQQAQSDKIALLEKKVKRLAGSLERAETERDSAQKRAHALESAGVLMPRNLMTAGLAEDDPDRERKLRLIKEIIAFNREVRRELKEAGRLLVRVPPRKEEAPPEGRAPDVVPVADPAARGEPVPQEAPVPQEEPAGLREAQPSAAGPVHDLEEGETENEVLIPTTGGEVDPDDLPWEPSGPPDPTPPRIRSLGKNKQH